MTVSSNSAPQRNRLASHKIPHNPYLLSSMRLRTFFPLFLATLIPLALPAQVADEGEEKILEGAIQGNQYLSPTGLYKVTIPVLQELGGDVNDTPSTVVFNDAFTSHITITVFPMDATQRWEMSTRGKKDYLVQFFANAILPDFRQRFPGTNVESAKFLNTEHDGALLAYTLIPNGTMFLQRIALFGQGDKIPVAKRGNLLFIRNDVVYIISIEMAERSVERSQYTMTTAQEDEILRTRLHDIANKMTFAAPAAPAVAPKAPKSVTAAPAAPAKK